MANVVVTIGSTAGITGIILACIAKIYADGLIEELKKTNQKNIEEFKSDLDIIRAQIENYNNEQFQKYQKLWEVLCDLKSVGKDLWHDLTNENRLRYAQKLKFTKTLIGKSRLLMEEEHYKELRKIVGEFINFRQGKEYLFNLYEMKKEIKELPQSEIENAKKKNKEIMIKYEQLLNKLAITFKNHLKRAKE